MTSVWRWGNADNAAELKWCLTAIPQKKQKTNTGAFFHHGLTSIPAWISNDLSCEVWGEITYPLANLNGAAVEVWELINL